MARRANKLSDDPVARRLALTRKALGYDDQGQFARDAGITPNAYNTSETGKRPLPLNQANQLCARYGLTLEWLYDGAYGRLQHDLVVKLLNLGAMDPPPNPGPKIIRKPRI